MVFSILITTYLRCQEDSPARRSITTNALRGCACNIRMPTIKIVELNAADDVRDLPRITTFLYHGNIFFRLIPLPAEYFRVPVAEKITLIIRAISPGITYCPFNASACSAPVLMRAVLLFAVAFYHGITTPLHIALVQIPSVRRQCNTSTSLSTVRTDLCMHRQMANAYAGVHLR